MCFKWPRQTWKSEQIRAVSLSKFGVLVGGDWENFLIWQGALYFQNSFNCLWKIKASLKAEKKLEVWGAFKVVQIHLNENSDRLTFRRKRTYLMISLLKTLLVSWN